jgi:hypothetical protein
VTGEPLSAETVPALGAQAAVAWIRIIEHFWSNTMLLARVPLELIAAEDECLGVAETTVYFPADAAQPTLEGARLMPSGQPARLRITPMEPERQGSTPIRVRLDLPPKTPFAICAFTLCGPNDLRKSYQQPFGVPGRRR